MDSQICLVTGAGTRVGLLICRHMLALGYDLLAHYHASKSGIEELTEIANKLGRSVIPIQGDFSTRNGIQSFIDAMNDKLGSRLVHSVIHSAAIMLPGRIEAVTLDDFDAIMNVNAIAPLTITQALAPRLALNSAVIMISDIATERLWREYPIYSMSKNQLEITCKHFAKALAPTTRVNILRLGLVIRSQSESEEVWVNRIERTPLKRSVSTDDLYRAIDLLLSNSSMTGSTITLDSGDLLR